MANFKEVGRIRGNALHGLCERMCINVDVVIDGCRNRRMSQTATVTLTDVSADAVFPFTFIRAEDNRESEFIVTGNCSGGSGCSSITGTLNIPITVTFTDANGVCRTAHGVISGQRELSLRVPRSPNTPYRIVGEATVLSTSGAFLSRNTLALTYCAVETFKTIIRADILVPTYGFAVFPDCEECGGCPGLLNSTFDENEI